MKLLAKQFSYFMKGLFLLIVSGFLIWMIFQPAWFQNVDIQVTEQPHARIITVSGEGEISSKPDMAVINLSVISQGGTVKAVTEDANKKMGRIVAAVKGLGVSEDDMQSTSYNLRPDYKYPENKKAVIAGYQLSQNLRVKVRDLTKVEVVLDEGVKQGANQVGQLSFEIDDDSELRDEAREIAFKDALSKAEKMVSAANVRLGKVVTFSEGHSWDEPNVYRGGMEMMAMSDEDMAPSIEPGTQETKITVSVTYEIE